MPDAPLPSSELGQGHPPQDAFAAGECDRPENTFYNSVLQSFMDSKFLRKYTKNLFFLKNNFVFLFIRRRRQNL
jgi:hypothetical protein